MRSQFRQPACAALLTIGLVVPLQAWGATSVAEVVQAFCASAYQAELSRQGRSLPASTIERTCACVGDQVARGSDVEDAQEVCGRSPDQRSVRTPTPKRDPATIN